MTKARQKKRKIARRLGLTKQKIPAFPSLPPPTEEELAELAEEQRRDAARAQDDFEAGFRRVR